MKFDILVVSPTDMITDVLLIFNLCFASWGNKQNSHTDNNMSHKFSNPI